MKPVYQKILFAALALAFSSGITLAQVGGADVPSNAKKEGTMENGPSSTGMSKGEAKSEMKDGGMKKEGGMMKKDDKM